MTWTTSAAVAVARALAASLAGTSTVRANCTLTSSLVRRASSSDWKTEGVSPWWAAVDRGGGVWGSGGRGAGFLPVMGLGVSWGLAGEVLPGAARGKWPARRGARARGGGVVPPGTGRDADGAGGASDRT